MPRKLNGELTFDALEDEILYTVAAVQADPDAADLVNITHGWLEKVDAVRTQDRGCRQSVANTTASRVVANQRLDYTCIDFGKDLLHDLDHDRSQPRWTQFFAVAPSQFVRTPLGDQSAIVQGWLASSNDPVLERFRADLTTWTAASTSAVVATRGLAPLRSQVWQARHQLGAFLTAERDRLHRALAERAEQRGLPRDWPDMFFLADSAEKADKPAAG